MTHAQEIMVIQSSNISIYKIIARILTEGSVWLYPVQTMCILFISTLFVLIMYKKWWEIIFRWYLFRLQKRVTRLKKDAIGNTSMTRFFRGMAMTESSYTKCQVVVTVW